MSHARLWMRCAACAAAILPLAAWTQNHAEPAARQHEAVFRAPDKPLDARIAHPEKITEQELPPLPQPVILPKPPVFELSVKPSQVPMDADVWRKAKDAVGRGLDYLRSTQTQAGVWLPGAKAAPTDQPAKPSDVSIAVTALVVKAFAQARPQALRDDPRLMAAVHALVAARNPDGSFDQGTLANYVTASVMSALASLDGHDIGGPGAFADHLRQGAQWLSASQWDQGEGLHPRQDWFGGAGYGSGGRPDLSNTQTMLDALHDAGLSPDEPAFQKALAFLSRTQNLRETNKADWAQNGPNDGGFVYSPANGGESMASDAAGEGRHGEKLVAAGQPRSLRSYGSMTYAGFKSMLYAGLPADDLRVRAAFDWIRRHWTFDENPGLGKQGLYYYYHTMARALNAAQQHEIVDHGGVRHNWRDELAKALLARQSPDGSWINADEQRWMESSPALVTAYSVLALEELLKPVTAAALSPGGDADADAQR